MTISQRRLRREHLLLQVWSEIGKHLRFEASMPVITRHLRPFLPVERLLLLEWQRNTSELHAVYSSSPNEPPRRSCGPAQIQALQRWAQQHSFAMVSAGERPRAPLSLLGDWPQAQACLIGGLHAGSQLLGLMMICGEEDGFGAEQVALFRALLEPVAVALANDQRMRELERLGAAAEADRLSLLSRLGRSSLSEQVLGAELGLKQVMQRVEQVAPTDATVLILGETGAGKEVIARAIHERSSRRVGAFVRVNCGAVAPDLIDSELFGHEKGAFTGALAMRRGWFERADGGTLFLDEIGELSLAAQVRLLRVLQDGLVQRVGGEDDISVNVRVVAATHRDLPGMVQEGHFREDLWYRLAVFLLILPPLRERLDDLPELVAHFVQRAARRLGLPQPAVSKREFERLAAYRWPGNIRELAAVLERAVILGQGQRLEVEAALGSPAPRSRSALAASVAERIGTPFENEALPRLDQHIAEHLRRALRHCKGRVDGPHGAAQLLGLNTSTLRAKLRKLRIDARPFRA